MASDQSSHAQDSVPDPEDTVIISIPPVPPIQVDIGTSDYQKLSHSNSLGAAGPPEALILNTIGSTEEIHKNDPMLAPKRDMSLSLTAVNGLKLTLSGSPTRQDSVIEVAQNSTVSLPYQATNDGPKNGKLTTQYVMPDGSVITGKGLGRGRPGFRRGPRKSKLPGDESVESTPSAATYTAESSSTSAVGKRKRADSESSNIRARSVSSSLSSRSSSIEYNPTTTQTRSGRQTQKPMSITTSTTTPSATASPAAKKVTTPINAASTLKTHPKIKRKVYRGKEQFALCEHCLRGFGPPENAIVFCDACNKCWHQNCHQPQIPRAIITDTKAEWFCATCDKILHGNKKAKKLLLSTPSKSSTQQEQRPPPPPPPAEQKFAPPFVGAIALTIDQRKKYLGTLSRDQLLNLLLRAGELAPQMPIFETPIPFARPPERLSLQPQFTSDYITPVTEIPGRSGVRGGAGNNNNNKVDVPDVPDEGYDDSYDEHAALYPKVGEGVKLPPEHEDLNILLEGPESRTFSHWVKGQPVKTVVDTVPLHLSQQDYVVA